MSRTKITSDSKPLDTAREVEASIDSYTVTFKYLDTDNTEKTFKEAVAYSFGTTYNQITVPSNYPILTSGYWVFKGWSLSLNGSIINFSGNTSPLNQDTVFYAVYSGAKINIPIDWDGASNVSNVDDSITCTWGSQFPSLPVVPEKNNVRFGYLDAVLMKDSTEKGTTHDRNGDGVLTVGSSLIDGSSTSASDTAITLEGYKILIEWADTVTVTFKYKKTDAVDAEEGTFATQQYGAGILMSQIESPSGAPQRDVGYWILDGWEVSSEDTSAEDGSDSSDEDFLLADTTMMAVFSAAQIKIPMNWNGASTRPFQGDYLTCTWGAAFPSLSPVPERSGIVFGFKEASLTGTGIDTPIQTHSRNGSGIGTVSYTALGHATSDVADTVFTVTGCEIDVVWAETLTLTFSYTEANGTTRVFTSQKVGKGAAYSSISAPAIYPVREKGYWIFEGWDIPSSGTVDANATIYAIFSAAQIKIPINTNGATNAAAIGTEMTCTWGQAYPALAAEPVLSGKSYKGAYLLNGTILITPNGIYADDSSTSDDSDSEAEGLVTADALGRGTSDESGHIFSAPEGIEIKIVWTDSNGKVTISFYYQNPGSSTSIQYGSTQSIAVFTPFEDIEISGFPTRNAGYWIFQGWGIPTSGVITGDMTFTASYTAAGVNIPINWDGADNADNASTTLECIWGEQYPELPIIPTREDALFAGAKLWSGTTEVIQTHGVDGKGATTVSSSALGSGTSNIEGTSFDAASGCVIKPIWEPEVRVDFTYQEDGETTSKVFATKYYPKNTAVTITAPDGYPIRDNGFWIFEGWAGLPTSAVTFGDNDDAISYMATFSAAQVSIPIAWNGADNVEDAGDYLVCTWGEVYTNLPVIPTKEEYNYKSAELVVSGTSIVETHNENGEGTSRVSTAALGNGTSDDPSIVFLAEPGCTISILWEAAVVVTFAYTEADGTKKVFATKTYKKNTSMSSMTAPSGFPERETGYWIFQGWQDFPGSGTLTEDIEFLANFTAAQIKIPVNVNGASNWDASYLTCTWGNTYSALIPVPSKNGIGFAGAILFNGTKFIVQTHARNGSGDATVNSTELGSGTTNNSSEVFEVATCKIKFFWEDSSDIVGDEESTSEPEEEETTDNTCTVNFIYTEEDGSTKTFASKKYEKGTSYSKISIPSGFPKRSTGYWLFKGWTETFSDTTKTLDESLTSEAKFSAATVRIPINWNGATNTSSAQNYIERKWGSIYSKLSVIPKKKNSTFTGAYLVTDTGRVVTRTHDADGKGVTTVQSTELGSGTAKGSSTVFPISTCVITIFWNDPIESNTLSDLRKEVGAIPMPFASDAFATREFPASSDDKTIINFNAGIPGGFVKPLINPTNGKVNAGARVITRRDVNTLGYIGTQEQFFEQCGGYYTFDKAISDAIGGYPESAILRYYDETLNCLRTVYSLVDNNTWNFLKKGVDGKHWKYIDDNPMLSLNIDYSDFLDLSSILFVETGQPDFYEVPFDGFLQLYAFSFCDMHSTLREESQYINMYVDTELNKDKVGTENPYDLVYAKINGAYAATFNGETFLDVHNDHTNTTTSLQVRQDGCTIFKASFWALNTPNGIFYAYKYPRYVISQGSLFLNKGDKIRIRGSYQERVTGSGFGDTSRVIDRVMTDQEVRRSYLCRFANLYRVGWRS